MGELADRRRAIGAEASAWRSDITADVHRAHERLREFADSVRGTGTIGLYRVVPVLGSTGGWRSRRVTIGDYDKLAQGWLITEGDVSSNAVSSRLFVVDEPQPRALQCSPLITRKPYYNDPPELPYVALHASHRTLDDAVAPTAFAYDQGLTWLAQAADRLTK